MIITEKMQTFLEMSISLKVSDLHLSVGTPPVGRIHGKLTNLSDEICSEEEMLKMVRNSFNEEEYNSLKSQKSLDCAVSSGKTRFRINVIMSAVITPGLFAALKTK